jgi:hypothetical protein
LWCATDLQVTAAAIFQADHAIDLPEWLLQHKAVLVTAPAQGARYVDIRTFGLKRYIDQALAKQLFSGSFGAVRKTQYCFADTIHILLPEHIAGQR